MRRQPNTAEKGHTRKLFREPLMRTVLAYEVNTMVAGDIGRRLGPRERFILIDGDRVLSGCDLNDQKR